MLLTQRLALTMIGIDMTFDQILLGIALGLGMILIDMHLIPGGIY